MYKTGLGLNPEFLDSAFETLAMLGIWREKQQIGDVCISLSFSVFPSDFFCVFLPFEQIKKIFEKRRRRKVPKRKHFITVLCKGLSRTFSISYNLSSPPKKTITEATVAWLMNSRSVGDSGN